MRDKRNKKKDHSHYTLGYEMQYIFNDIIFGIFPAVLEIKFWKLGEILTWWILRFKTQSCRKM